MIWDSKQKIKILNIVVPRSRIQNLNLLQVWLKHDSDRNCLALSKKSREICKYEHSNVFVLIIFNQEKSQSLVAHRSKLVLEFLQSINELKQMAKTWDFKSSIWLFASSLNQSNNLISNLALLIDFDRIAQPNLNK